MDKQKAIAIETELFEKQQKFPYYLQSWDIAVIHEAIKNGNLVLPSEKIENETNLTTTLCAGYSKIIEQALLHILFSPLIVAENEKYEIIDQKDQALAFYYFFENRFALTNLKLLTNIGGLFYQDLPTDLQETIRAISVQVIVFVSEPTTQKPYKLFFGKKNKNLV